MNFLRKILYILPSSKAKLLLLILAFLFVSTIEAFGIGVIGPFISLASNPELVEQNRYLNLLYNYLDFEKRTYFIAFLGLFIVFIFLCKGFVSWLAQSAIFRFSFAQQAKLINRLMQTYMSVPYTFHLDKNSALVIQNIVDETRNYTNGILIPLLVTISNIVIIVCLTILLAITNIATVVIVLGMVFPLLILVRVFRSKIKSWGKQSSQAIEAIIRIVNHALGGIKETVVIGCSPYFEEQLFAETQKHQKAMGNFFAFQLLPRVFIEAFLIIFLVGFTSIYLLYNNNIQALIPILSVFGIASIRLIPATNNLISSISNLRKSSYTVNKLYLDLKELENVPDAHKRKKGNKQASPYTQYLDLSFNIMLKNVTYRYPQVTEYALKDVSLEIKKGESIALIGKSGAGKTTLVDVILGLLTPEFGDITVDGWSIYNDIRSWQNMIGYIPQSIFLIDDTVANNIAFGVPEHLIDPERLDKAIKSAQLDELINDLPHGVQTMVGERGVRFSGGQRQRIGIARALYHEREVLVLDEATSALDNETENLIMEAINEVSKTKTMIFIAHRLSTVEQCDRIYLMKHGKIIKSGTYQEVVLESHE